MGVEESSLWLVVLLLLLLRRDVCLPGCGRVVRWWNAKVRRGCVRVRVELFVGECVLLQPLADRRQLPAHQRRRQGGDRHQEHPGDIEGVVDVVGIEVLGDLALLLLDDDAVDDEACDPTGSKERLVDDEPPEEPASALRGLSIVSVASESCNFDGHAVVGGELDQAEEPADGEQGESCLLEVRPGVQ
ncbi:hypothetical protein V8E36_008951 [Tilletia maclaganii]